MLPTMADEEDPEHIYTSTVEKMIVDGKPKWRLARFLLPIADNIEGVAGIPHAPLLSELFPHNLHQWPLKVVCKGWNRNLSCTHQKWKEWVHQLAPKYETLWVQVGVRDAIYCSTYELRYNQEIILGLIEFWCNETNTFVFPWGEATITLEDVMVLGGYPLVGEFVGTPDLDSDLEGTVLWLEKCRMDLLRINKKKICEHAAWIRHFMEEVASNYEHVAFLSFWLSRYVFPFLSGDAFDNHVFPIAAKLSLGVKVALGPVVLANLYHKLRQTRDAFESSFLETAVISGHFEILQVWAFERFPVLVLGLKKPVTVVGLDEPRIARWHKVIPKLNIPIVRSALRLPENFEWRPYADLKKSIYKEKEQLIDCLSLNEELLSYVRCVHVSELVGTDGCREKYLPNRVAMQFGMDQDLPAVPHVLNSTRELVSIFVPSISFQSGVSLRYSNWWKDSMIAREVALKDALSQTRKSRESRILVVHKHVKEEEYDNPVEYLSRPSKTMRKGVHDADDSHTRKIDSSSLNVRESVGKRLFSATNKEKSPQEIFFESLNCEWVTAVGCGPKNPIDVDEDPHNCPVLLLSSKSSGTRTDLEGRIQKLEKMLGVK